MVLCQTPYIHIPWFAICYQLIVGPFKAGDFLYYKHIAVSYVFVIGKSFQLKNRRERATIFRLSKGKGYISGHAVSAVICFINL